MLVMEVILIVEDMGVLLTCNLPQSQDTSTQTDVMGAGLWLASCQGVTPSNSKVGLPAPEARARAEGEASEMRLTHPLAGRRARKTKQDLKQSG